MKKVLSVIVGLSLTAMLAGCEATAKSDHFDPCVERTASSEAIMTKVPQPSPITPRTWQETSAQYAAPVVTHFPYWYEDPVVVKGDGNDTYGWTGDDWLAMVYCPCRFVVNTVGMPISMIKDPPGKMMCTDLDQPIPACMPPCTQPATQSTVTVNGQCVQAVK
jgi:hypothetical protein